jgi:hypothetical protein
MVLQLGAGREVNNFPTTDQILCIHQILEKKWEYNGTVQELFVDFNKAFTLEQSIILSH